LLLSSTIPVIDGDPWPWPIVHGLVMLAFVVAVAWRPPSDLSRFQQIGTGIIVWIGTAALFGVSVPEGLRAGWIFGVTAAAAAGVMLRWYGGARRPAAASAGRGLAATLEGRRSVGREWVAGALLGFREAFLRWRSSPPTGPSVIDRVVTGRPTATWIRRITPWALAFGAFWIGVASIHETLEVHDLVLPLLAALIALPIGLLRRYALLGWRLATVVAIVVAVVGTQSDGRDPSTWPVIQQWVWLIATYVASLRHERWTAFWIWAVTVTTMSAGTTDNAGTAVTLVVAASASALIADLVRTRRLASRDLERQTELSELEKARRTVLEERTRIARELHDVVAHHMSMVVVQAESAPYRLNGLTPEATAEFASISGSARQALTEIRALLGVLRSDGEGRSRAPQPGLGDVGALVEAAERSGLQVELRSEGEPREVGDAVGLSAYRIVQESLANAARHAPGAPVEVTVDHDDDELRLRIVNGAATTPTTPSPPGHGLVGMRERATVVGGTLRAGPRAGGGFEVEARLPYVREVIP
jgi:signal transduction histidine kinase